MHSQVFGRFQKLNEFTQWIGLGLAISKAIIEAAGGEIGFTSEPGVGSTFWGWVRVRCPCPDLSSLPPCDRPGGFETRRKKILVGEDNDSNYALSIHVLKDYDLMRAENVVEAVDAVRNGNFGFVLMDLKMPIMGGLEATRKIREFDTEILIIALTVNTFDSDRESAMETGCNAFLTKPVKKKQLLELFL